MRVLILADSYRMAYRVMRIVDLAGAEAHVLGTARARGLARSRYCRTFQHAPDGFEGNDLSPAEARINQVIAARGIDMVMPADPRTSRLIIAVRKNLAARCFPAPDIETFDQLNNKAAFTDLMTRLGGKCPPSRVFSDRAALASAWKRGEIATPAIAKPLCQSGGAGVRKLTRRNGSSAVAGVDYEPILVQDLVPGLDVSASVYCQAGNIIAFTLFRKYKRNIQFFESEVIELQIQRLASHLNLDGIFNFDLIITPDEQEIFWLECNPRVFYSIDMVAIAGVNLVAFGLGAQARSSETRVPRGAILGKISTLCFSLIRPWSLSNRDRTFLRFWLSDPAAFLREAIGLARA